MPEATPQPIPMNLDPAAYALTNMSIDFDEEQFMLRLTSGNQLRGYLVTPKHAKRISMLLTRQVEDYEKKWGELTTTLPKQPKNTDQRVGF